MKYDFESVPDRSGCGSLKWDSSGVTDPEYAPLSVADMEFPTAPAIKEAIVDVAENRILGYTQPTQEYYDAVCSWMKRKHGFEIKKEWILTTPGVVDALAVLVDAVTNPGEGVIILTPVYYPFDLSVMAKSRKIVYSTLINNDGHYEIDFADLEKKAKMKNVTALMFCNPHNPVGRVWTKQELKKVADICCENGLFIIDDEIHNDIIMPGYEHTIMATVSSAALDNIAVCTAPSKTFNIAGLQCSNIIIPNETARAKAASCSLINMNMGLNIFAYTACTAAYTKCDDWLEQMLETVKSNADYVTQFMAENFESIKVIPLEGTYLLWLDMRQTGLTHKEMKRLLEDNHIYLDNGEMFGEAGRGYQRINLACSRVTLKKALERFKSGMEKVYAEWDKSGKPYHKTLVKGEKLENFVYDSAYGTDRQLDVKNTALIIFGRFYDCPVTKGLLEAAKGFDKLLKRYGCDIKFVIQSDLETVSAAQKNYDFELIADGEAKLYDKYNVFEADGIMGIIGDDKLVNLLIGKNVKKFLKIKAFSSMISTYLDSAEEPQDGKRSLQLPAFVLVNKDMEVIYSHYCRTVSDLPKLKEIMKGVKG